MARGSLILCSKYKFRFFLALLIITVLFWTNNQFNPQPMLVPQDPISQQIPEDLESIDLKSNYSKMVYITRMISNDLPPIHFADQTYLNTKTILENEELPSNFRRYWLLYCFANKTTEQRLVRLIESKKEKYHIVPLSSSSEASDVIKETLNNDRARNIGLKKSLEEGAKWTLNLDGAQIMTQEGIHSLDKALKRAEGNSQIFHFVPLIRLLFRIEFSESLNYRQLFPYVSGLEECTVAVHQRFLFERPKILFLHKHKGLLYDEDREYGYKEKLQFLQEAKEHLSAKQISCSEAMIGFTKKKAKSADFDQDLLTLCGYSVRLPYHPEEDAPYNQTRAVVKRFYPRQQSVAAFKQLLTKIAASNAAQQTQ